MGKSLSIHKNLIRKTGDREVVGVGIKWLGGRNTLTDAIEKELEIERQGRQTGLRDSAVSNPRGRGRS